MSDLVNVFLEEQFSFNGYDIRTVYIERVPYLLGKDVCFALGYNENTYRNGMKDNVPDKYKVRYENLSNLGLSKRVWQTRLEKAIHKEAIFFTEPGLYCMLARCKKEEAEPFMDWVVETILPKEVRKLAQKIDEKDSALALLNDDLNESQLALQRERSLRRLQSHNLTIANNLLEVRSREIENLIINRHVPLSGRGYESICDC